MKPERHHSKPENKPLVAVESAEPAAEPLKCVWSGHPHYDRDCRSRIPASVVVRAWQREMQLKGAVEGFFNFTWRHGVWLAFGLSDGNVRGVYCPTHCSERDLREINGAPPHCSEGDPGEVQVEDLRADQPAGAALQ
jgi:hypothetical protein